MKFRSLLIFVISCAASCIFLGQVQADIGSTAGSFMSNQTAIITHDTSANLVTTPAPPTLIPPAPKVNVKGYALMDADSGQILAQENMDERMPPASLTKLMTIYVTEQALAQGKIKMDETARVSENAWHTGGSRMFLKLGTQVGIKDLLDGVIIASGNDASVVLAEFIAGSEDSFTAFMNQNAKHLGMVNTNFTDANGLPHPYHYSSPHDLAILARALINQFPQYYSLFKQKWFLWNNIKQPNRNRLLWRDPTVDGLKTGHTQGAGYCLVSSAKRKNMRLISVVMGAPTDAERSNYSQALLNWGFRFFETHKLFDGNKILATPRIWQGNHETAPMGLAQTLYVTIPSGSYSQLKANLRINPNLKAPIYKGRVYGKIVVKLGEKTVTEAPLVALQDDIRGGIWTRFTDRIAHFLHGLFSSSSSGNQAPQN